MSSRPSLKRQRLLAVSRGFFTFLAAVGPLTALADDAIAFRAVCFNPGNTPPPVVYLPNGGKREKFEIPITYLGGPCKANLRDGGWIDFFNAEKDEKPAFSAQVPPGEREHLLVVLIPSGSNGYQAKAMALPSKGFDGGALFAVNFYPSEVAVRRGDGQAVPIKVGEARLLGLPDKYQEPMILTQFFKRGQPGSWAIEQSARWPVDREFRSYVFLYQRGDRLDVHEVDERMLKD